MRQVCAAPFPRRVSSPSLLRDGWVAVLEHACLADDSAAFATRVACDTVAWARSCLGELSYVEWCGAAAQVARVRR